MQGFGSRFRVSSLSCFDKITARRTMIALVVTNNGLGLSDKRPKQIIAGSVLGIRVLW